MVFGLAMAMTLMGAGFTFAASEDVVPADEVTPVRERVGEAVRDGFEGLTDEQKAEIYAITDEQETLREKVMDKLVEFGVLDQETADQIKARHAERYAAMKENGSFFGGPKGQGRGGQGERVAQGERGGRGGMRGNRGSAANGDCPVYDATENTPDIEATDFN